nr:Uncharacterised protein [Raoultella sp. NCTC 9187]
MSAGVKVAVAPLNVDDKAHIAEETRFGGHVEPQEGHPTLVDFAAVLEVSPGDVHRMIHFHDIDDGTAGFLGQLAEFAVQFTHLQPVATLNDGLQTAIALRVVRVEHRHHLVLI